MKTTFLTLIALSALAFSSCKKPYTCQCTVTVIETGFPDEVYTTSTTINNTKKKAKAACEGLNSSTEFFGIKQTAVCGIR